MRLPEVSRHFVADARTTGGSLFRIYRDVRFSKDKSPYKTHVGIQFRHARARDVHAPGFYLHLEPGSVFMACGTWHPDRDTLHAIRTAIAAKPGRWQAIVEEPAFRRALPARRRGAQAPAGGLRPRSPADRGAQAQGLHRRRRPDRGRRDAPAGSSTAFLGLCGEASAFMRFLCDSARVADGRRSHRSGSRPHCHSNATSGLAASPGAQKRAVRSASSLTAAWSKSVCGLIMSFGPSMRQLAATRPSTVTVQSPLSVSFSGWTSGGMMRSRSA